MQAETKEKLKDNLRNPPLAYWRAAPGAGRASSKWYTQFFTAQEPNPCVLAMPSASSKHPSPHLPPLHSSSPSIYFASSTACQASPCYSIRLCAIVEWTYGVHRGGNTWGRAPFSSGELSMHDPLQGMIQGRASPGQRTIGASEVVFSKATVSTETFAY
ncbi:hypothetical protein Cgig2_028762 [Carnegiea gigantea]|uniref:Uncharacterized protein n=1 Tax=Carnegiea gigantea TaxID=171969 RepID=A0A9Q1JQK9_9CARY|nr:hypothetical protein Cgig2_028762 [Carnegiea gigantea]